MFTNFSPRRHVNDFKGTYFVEKINIYQIKNIFVFTSKDPRIEEFISSAAHFNWVVEKFNEIHSKCPVNCDSNSFENSCWETW